MRPPVLRAVSRDYPDNLPEPAQVRCYGFEEVFAEKLRAMGERSRPRDLYDIVNLFRRPDFRQHAALVGEKILLHALHAESGEHRSYRLESARVTTQPFTPSYAIEFPESGAIPALPSARRSTGARRSVGRRRSRSGEPRYVVECPMCGKRFRRKRQAHAYGGTRTPGALGNARRGRGTQMY